MDRQLGAAAALDDSARRLDAVLNNATVAILLMDHRQHCVYMNRAAEELTGYSFAEVEALDKPLHDIIHHTHPDGRAFPIEECAIDRAFPEHHQVQGDEIFVHKDGSFYPVAFTASPIQDECSNTVGTIIELRDTREEILARERQRLLVDELNHRARNTLATIQSVAWQSLRDIDPETLERFNNRLAALSRAHSILTDQSWQGAELRQILKSALEPFGVEHFDIEGPPCDLDPKATVSLSMVLHELGANALRFGALASDQGSVAVSWSVDEDGWLELRWQEQGGPAVRQPSRRGFGLRLIERQLAAEFGGSAAVSFEQDGIVCDLRLKLPPVAAPLNLEQASSGKM